MPYKDPKKQKDAQRSHYLKRKDWFLGRQEQRRQRSREYIWSIKERSNCKNCDECHPATLDFHHRDPTKKNIEASKMIANKYSNARIDKELEKCDILCANCHRKLHFELKQDILAG